MIAEVTASLIWSHKHQIDPEDIRAKAGHIAIRVHDVALGFGDLRAIFGNHAIGSEALERLLKFQVALAAFFKPGEKGASSLGRGHTRVPGRVDQRSWLNECFLRLPCRIATTRLDN